MNLYKFLITIVLLIFTSSCSQDEKKYFHIKKSNLNEELTSNDTLEIEFSSNRFNKIDEIKCTFQDLDYTFKESLVKIPLSDVKLGKWTLNLQISAEDHTEKQSKEVQILNYQKPIIYTYEIIDEFPHDSKAYTQGLEFYGDTLYESTGQYGQSSLRKVHLESGEVLQQIDLSKQYFGEGLTLLNNQIFQLTWREGVGFIYDLQSFERIDEFEYTTGNEGWGLCNDGELIYKSDGSEKIWIINPTSLSVVSHIQPTTHKGKSSRLNELEWVDGKIYANTYQKEGVAIINPNNGAVEGIIDLRGLKALVKPHAKLDVLNGIAYHKDSQRLFVTGKNWNKLFEIKIIKK